MNKMKKISIITIILYMFFISSSFAATATIDVNSARLREEANTTSKVLTNIYKGEKVEILEKNGEWYKVKYGSNTGYLKNTLIKEEAEENDKKEEVKDNNTVKDEEKTNNISNNSNTDYNKVIAISTLNIRYQPNMMSNIILQVEKDTELTKIAKLGNWYQVSNGEVLGWVLEEKIKISNSSTTQNDVATEDNNKANNKTNTVKDTNTINENKTTNKVSNTVNNVANNTVNNTAQTNKVNTNKNETTTQNQITSVNKKAKVNVETAKVRKTADKTAKVIGFLDYNDEITILAEEGEWYKFTEKDTAGYVHKTLVALIEDNTVSSRGTNEEREGNKENTNTENIVSNETSNNQNTSNVTSNKGQEVVELAKKYLGYKYVVGGKNPTSGFDCSGFTRYIYLQFGYSLGTTASGQNNLGVEVSRENLKAGDLILFYDEAKTKIGHTGIYISNGDFIHSANPERGVVIDNINTNSYYNERYIVAKRIVE